MRTLKIAGQTVLRVKYKSGGVYSYTDSFHVLKHGRRVRITTDNIVWIKRGLENGRLNDYVGANAEGGPKTLARLIENTLLYGHDAQTVESDATLSGKGRLCLEKAGPKHIKFVAPCGQVGIVTNLEATRLMLALRAL